MKERSRQRIQILSKNLKNLRHNTTDKIQMLKNFLNVLIYIYIYIYIYSVCVRVCNMCAGVLCLQFL